MEIGGLVGLFLLDRLEDAEQRLQQNIQRRILRDSSNPFELSERDFIKNFRVSRQIAHYTIEFLRPFLPNPQRTTGINVELKVLTLLAFLGHGSYQTCVGNNFNLALEQSTVSRIIEEVAEAVVAHMAPLWIVFPRTQRALNSIKQGFHNKFNFPGIIGAIDCTHIAIVAPKTDDPIRPGIAYYNRKGFYSINVQLICDSDLLILNCNARFPGSVHDSGIWSLSSVRAFLQEKHIRNELNSSWLIGDSGYPLEPWLLTPIDNAAEHTPEGRFTHAHIRSRNTIERTNGLFKSRFRCFLKHRVLHYAPDKAGKLIIAGAVMHNMCIKARLPDPEEVDEPDEPQMNIEENIDIGEPNDIQRLDNLAEGRQTRNRIVRMYFSN